MNKVYCHGTSVISVFILEHVNCKATELALLTTPELLLQVYARFNYIVLIAVCLSSLEGVGSDKQ